MSYNCLSKTTLALPLSGLIGTTTACGRHPPPNWLSAHRTCGEVTDLHSYVANYNALKICQIRKRWLDGLSLWSPTFSYETILIFTPLNVSASTTLYSIERLTHPIIYFLLPVVFWMGSITLFLRVACIELGFWLVLGVCVAGGGSVRFVQGPSPDRGINLNVSSVTSLQ